MNELTNITKRFLSLEKSLQDSKDKIFAEMTKLEKRANDTNPTPMEIKTISKYKERGSLEEKIFNKRVEYLFMNDFSRREYSTVEQFNKRLEEIKNQASITLERYEKEHELNKEAINNNIKVRDHIKTLMSAIGINEIYSEWTYKTSRSRNKTEKKQRAGYLSDLDRVLKTNDNYNELVKSLNERLKVIESFANEKIKKIEEEKEKKEKEAKEERKKIEKLKKLAFYQVKYNLAQHTDLEAVLFTILNKNKYLDLAHSMITCRGDFSESEMVQDSLDAFEIEKPLDEEIYTDVLECLNPYDGDGRVFRDCEYNYNILFSFVKNQNEDLYQDYLDIKKLIEGEYGY